MKYCHYVLGSAIGLGSGFLIHGDGNGLDLSIGGGIILGIMGIGLIRFLMEIFKD